VEESRELPSPPPEEPSGIFCAASCSWILYDLANTVYAASITYLFVPFYGALFQNLTAIGLTQTITMVASSALAILMGAVSDRTGRSVQYLAVATLICIGSMVGWAFASSQWSLLSLLVLGGLAYQVAIVFYDALLASVATNERAGVVS